MFAQLLVSGLTDGAIYSLIALGLAIVYNATSAKNFANGEFVMMGGLLSAVFIKNFEISVWLSLIATVVVVSMLATLIQVTGFRLARTKSVLNFTFITIGFSITFKGAVEVALGKEYFFPPSLGLIPPISTPFFLINSQRVWILVALISISIALTYLFTFTRLGKAMRAASQQPRAAVLCGIDPQKMATVAFLMAGFSGAVAGVLIAPIGGAFYDFGLVYALKGFAAAALGGFGSPVGAVIGGLSIGVIESISTGYLGSQFKDAITYSILVLIILYWPSGLFGDPGVKRV